MHIPPDNKRVKHSFAQGMFNPFLTFKWQWYSYRLAFTYPEHLGTADRAYTSGGWSAIFHGYCLGILHFPLGSTLNAIGLHYAPPF
jgi:hypothetical protein